MESLLISVLLNKIYSRKTFVRMLGVSIKNIRLYSIADSITGNYNLTSRKLVTTKIKKIFQG